MKLVNLQCPNCGGTLSKEGEHLVCHACGGAFSVDYDESDVEYEKLKTEPEREQRRLEHEKELLEKRYELEHKRSGSKKLIITMIIVFAVIIHIVMAVVITVIQNKQKEIIERNRRIESEETEDTTEPSPTPTPSPNYNITPEDVAVLMDDLIETGQLAEMDITPCNVENRNGIPVEYDKTGAVFIDAYLITDIPQTKPAESNRVVLFYEVSWHNDEEGNKTCYDAVYFEGLRIYPGDTKVVCSYDPETIDRSDAAWGWFFNKYSYETYDQCYRENVTALGGNVMPITQDITDATAEPEE